MKMNKLLQWQRKKIKEAKERGDEMFLGIPDAWYEPPHWACENGHVSTSYLKSEEKGDLCLECYEPIVVVPDMTEADLAKILGVST